MTLWQKKKRTKDQRSTDCSSGKKIPTRLHTYEAPDGFLDGVSVAAQSISIQIKFLRPWYSWGIAENTTSVSFLLLVN